MEKIVIIGSPGAGKSTLARKLGRKLHIKVVHLDRVFWHPGWGKKTRDIRIEILQEIVREKQWIIEGTYLGLSEPRLDAADTIIFLDIDPLLCLRHIYKRHQKFKQHPKSKQHQKFKLPPQNPGPIRPDIQEGCTDKLTLPLILKVLAFPFRGRRTLIQKLRKFPHKKVIQFHSTKEVEDFLAQLEPHAEVKRKLSKIPSGARKSHLATAR